jgi:ribosomal protein S18 acetylase RimI-like enzyme
LAKYFAYPNVREIVDGVETRISGGMNGRPAVIDADFRRLAFRALPVFEKGGLWFSAHLDLSGAMFEKAWKIYSESFSDFEKRHFQNKVAIHSHPRYRFSAVMDGDRVAGVLAVWRMPEFWFVEHLAISPEIRSAGLGGRCVRLLQDHARTPILLDVEPRSMDAQAERRVAFYERMGFHYCDEAVTLPPYAGKRTGVSHLMAWPHVLDGTGRDDAVAAISRTIYNEDAVSDCRCSVAV